MENDKTVTEFLDAQKKSTRFTYVSNFKHYLEFAKKSGSELLEAKKNAKDGEIENTIFTFRKWLLEKGYSENYAKSSIGCVRGFYAYHRQPLVFRKSEAKKLKEASRLTEDYPFDKEDLGKMALCGNLKERYVLLIGKSVGLRASDFLSFTYGNFRSLKLDSDVPVSIGQTKTLKEHVNAFPFLDGDAIPIIQQILESNKDKKDSEKVLADTEENLSVILQNLAKKSGVEPHGKRIRFHCLRKFLIDRLSAYASESQWKQIVGKSIEEGAYVTTEQLRNVFGRAMKDIAINGNGGKTKKLIELETELTNTKLILKGMIDAFGVDIYNKAITKLSIQPSEMKSRFRRDSAIPEKETIPYETIIETLKKLATKT
jgi:hypothetical protein